MASLDSNTSTFIPFLSTSATQVVHIFILVSTKLDRTDFLTRQSQIEPIVDGYGFTRYLDASPVLLPCQISSNSQLVSNLEFTTWHRRFISTLLRQRPWIATFFPFNRQDKLQCQVCKKRGHKAFDC